jgi:hypothetical protein
MPEPNPLTNIATKSMGMMPGMGLAMGAGSVLGGLMGGGGLHGKEIGNLLGFEDKNTNNKQKLEFDNITINSLKIEEASIGNLTVESMDKKEDSDFDKIVDETGDKKNIKEDKGFLDTLWDYSLPGMVSGLFESKEESGPDPLKKEDSDFDKIVDETGDKKNIKEDKGFLDTLWDYSLPGMVSGLFESKEESEKQSGQNFNETSFTGEMGKPPTTPIETMSDANLEASEVLLGQSSFGGGLPSIGEDLSDAVSLLQEISDNTKAIEEMFNWEEFKTQKGGADRGWIDQIFDGIYKPFSMAWGAITDTVSGLWKGVTDTVSGLWKGVTDTVSGLWTGVKDVASGIWEGVKDVAGGIWEGVKDTASGIWEGVKDVAGGIWEGVKDTASGIWEGITDTVSGLWTGVTETVSGAFTTVADTIGTAFSSVFEGAKEVAGGVWEGVGDVFGFDTASDVEAKAAAEANNQGGERGPMMWMDTVGNITAIRDSSYRLEDSLIEIKDILTDYRSWTMKTGDYNDPFDDEDIALDDFSIENPVAVYEDRTEIPEPESVSDINEDRTEIPEPELVSDHISYEDRTEIPEPELVSDHISYEDRTEIPELVSDINEDHKELESTLRENIIEKSLNMDSLWPTKQSASSKQHARMPRDRNISTVQENAAKPRGMMPSYTKAPPPPRGMNQKTINELQTYLRFPKWWTRMG